MAATGMQRTEGPRVVVVRAVIGHLALLGVFFVPVTRGILIATAIGYVIRVFAVEAGVHRYFSHRSFKTSRWFQLVLAAAGAANGQRGPIWWAVIHRTHHRLADQAGDPHSPVSKSLWRAYYGWLIDQETLDTDLSQAPDLARYPELVWVNKHHYVFPLSTIILTFLAGQFTSIFGRTGLGLSAVVWVFFVSMIVSQHVPYWVNVWAHGTNPGFFNVRRFDTGETSTNIWWLAIPTLGAAWHNNHHRYMNSARTGFYWYELDLTYLILRLLAALRIIWDLHPVPDRVLQEGRRARPSAIT